MPALSIVEYSLSFTDGPVADFQVIAQRVSESIDGGCEMVVDFGCEELPPLAEFLGSTCELAMGRGNQTPQYVYGVVQRVDFLGRAEHRAVVRIHACSAFELGKQRIHSRIWQDCSVLDIVDEVLGELFGDHERSVEHDGVARGSSPRVYCVQYRETDHAFVRRLLAEEGISYHFVHDPDRGHEVMTLCDSNTQYRDAENVDGGPSYPLITHAADQAELEALHELSWSRALTSTAVLRGDFDWQTPSAPLSAEVGGADERDRIRRVHAHGQRRFERDDLAERGNDLVEALGLAGSVARGKSQATSLRPGLRFETDAWDEDGAPNEWIVTKVVHRGGSGRAGALALGADEPAYVNEFECVPTSAAIRPMPTAKPRIHGPQTATVVGDDEIHTDEFGRVQVQMHWEEGASFSAAASCWIRCAQSWASSGWGAQFIPRRGMEVVVEFLEGNPDRPLIIGCVYNGANTPPFDLPANKTQSGWRTNSSPGGGGSNELRFEDAAGGEEIYIHGQKDWRAEVNNDTTRSTGHDDSISVGHDRSKSVANNQSESVGADKTITVGSNHNETIGAAMTLAVGTDQSVQIGADQKIAVGGALSETIGSTATQTVTLAKTTTVGAAYAITVGAAMATTVGAAMNTMVGAASLEQVGGLKSVSVGASSSLKVAGKHSVSAANIAHTAGKKYEVTAGSDFMVKAAKQVGIAAEAMATNVKKKYAIDAGDEFVIKCGSASLAMKKNGDVTIKGKNITINGSSKITLKGSKIHEN